MTQAAAPTTTATTSAPPKNPRKIAWQRRQAMRLARALKDINDVIAEFEAVDEKQAAKHNVNNTQMVLDAKEAASWIVDLGATVDKIPRLFSPRVRTRTVTVYNIGDTIYLRADAPSTYSDIADQAFTITSVERHSVAWRTASGVTGVGLVSHFQHVPPSGKSPGRPGRRRRVAST